jgi:hypothetical protein
MCRLISADSFYNGQKIMFRRGNLMKTLRAALFFLLVSVLTTLTVYAQDPESTREPQGPESDIIATIKAQSEPRIERYGTHPESRWQVQLTIYDCVPVVVENGKTQPRGYETLELVTTSAEGERIQLIEEQVHECGERVGPYGLAFLQWSPDLGSLYYTRGRAGAPDGAIFGMNSMIRLEVRTMTSQELDGGRFSHDGTMLATFSPLDRMITLYNANQSEPLASFDPVIATGVQTGFFWLSDKSGLISIEADGYQATHTVTSFIDAETLERTVILETDAPAD